MNCPKSRRLCIHAERKRERSHGDCVLISSVGLREGFLGVKITRSPYLYAYMHIYISLTNHLPMIMHCQWYMVTHTAADCMRPKPDMPYCCTGWLITCTKGTMIFFAGFHFTTATSGLRLINPCYFCKPQTMWATAFYHRLPGKILKRKPVPCMYCFPLHDNASSNL